MPITYRLVAHMPVVPPKPSYSADELDEALSALVEARKNAPPGMTIELVKVDADDRRVVTTPLVVETVPIADAESLSLNGPADSPD